MSTPEPRVPAPEVTTTPAPNSGQLTTRPKTAGPTRTEWAVAWVGNHLAELSGLALASTLMFTVSDWFAVLTGVLAALWLVHEWRARRGDNDKETGS
jgi:hypothetical protein